MIQTLHFFDTVDANSNKTVVSTHLRVPYWIKYHRVRFPEGTERKLKIYLYYSWDPETPTTQPPEGHNFLSDYAATPYIVGDGETVEGPDESLVREMGSWLKVYAVNEDSFEHTIDVDITIDMIIEPERLRELGFIKEAERLAPASPEAE